MRRVSLGFAPKRCNGKQNLRPAGWQSKRDVEHFGDYARPNVSGAPGAIALRQFFLSRSTMNPEGFVNFGP